MLKKWCVLVNRWIDSVDEEMKDIMLGCCNGKSCNKNDCAHCKEISIKE